MRPVRPYDHLEHWTDWRIEFAELHGIGEVFHPARKLILIDPTDAEQENCLAHASAHIALGHHQSARGVFTAQEEADADGLAQIWTTPLQEWSGWSSLVTDQ